jgi:hypothetical protein
MFLCQIKRQCFISIQSNWQINIFYILLFSAFKVDGWDYGGLERSDNRHFHNFIIKLICTC